MSDSIKDRICVTEDGQLYREGQEPDKCGACSKKSQACISFLAHENAMMHKDTDNERAHRTTLFVCITFIIITIIFVFAYTIRMNAFLDTIKEMNAVLVQIANAKGFIAP